jgi:hypothetical protein
MISPITAILRQARLTSQSTLNILTAPTHERYETILAETGHNFYAYQHPQFKGWATKYAPIPKNYTLLNKSLDTRQIPLDLDFDLVLSQNKFGQFQILSQLAQQLHLPVVSLEHTLPVPQWPEQTLQATRQMRGNVNVFISDYSIGQWGWKPENNDTCVIRHAVDAELFRPLTDEYYPRENHILTVANDYIGRDWCLNFQQYKRVTEGLPRYPVGDTKGLSVPAESTDELVKHYQRSAIFLNTAHISPIPTSLLEAMSCGCACVSIAASEIPHYIEHGVNGFLARNDAEMRSSLEILLRSPQLCKKLGDAARETILDKCNKTRFISEWNEVFYRTASTILKG